MNNTSRIIFLHLTLFCKLAFAQDADLPSLSRSPQAASLGKYGDTPISFYSGTPNISIDLYELNSKGVSVPIYLQYDASGIRIDGHPGPVGQNWSLMAGGLITRSVKGMVDEYSLDIPQLVSEWQSAFETMTPGGLFHSFTVTSNATFEDVAESFNQSPYTRGDFEPDIFTFNFLGFSGKFYFSSDGDWKVVSDQNIKVEFDHNNPNSFIDPFYSSLFPTGQGYDWIKPKVIKGFTLVDDAGTKYVFGYVDGDALSENAIEYTAPFWDQMVFGGNGTEFVSCVANTWHLSEIVDVHGSKLFEFEGFCKH